MDSERRISCIEIKNLETAETVIHIDYENKTVYEVQNSNPNVKRIEITPDFYEEVYGRKMILCKKCGKIMSYNSYFGCYYCTSCGYLGNAGNVNSKEVSE